MKATVVLQSLFSLALASAQAPQIEWARQFGGSGFANESASSIAADGGGNMYVVGSTNGALPGNTSAGLNDAFIRKYDAAGNVIWSRQFGTPSVDVGAAVAVDPSGAVYVAGRTEGSLGQPSAGLSDAYVRKFDAAGNVLWTRQFGTAVFDTATGVAADASGVYLTGRADAALPGQTFAGVSDAYVRKYDPSGSELWTRQFGSAFFENPQGIFADSSGVYAGGLTEGVIQDPLTPQSNTGIGDAYLRKYSLSGDHLWSRTFGTVGNDNLFGINGDATSIYVVGLVNGALPGQPYLGNADAYVRKYTRDGAEIWTREFGTSQFDGGFQVFADASGVYSAGQVSGALPGQTFVGINDAFVRKYTADGVLLWTRQVGSILGDSAGALSGDAFGVYAAGFANAALPGQVSAGNSDAFVLKFDASGTNVWTRQFGYPGPAVDQALAIASDGAGNTYGAGTTNGSLPGQTSAGVNDAFLRKYDASGALLWTRQFGTPTGDQAVAVGVDSSGVYVGGFANAALPGQTHFGQADAYVRKYDADGNLLWTHQFGSPASEQVNAIAVDATGVYAAGQTNGALPGQFSSGNTDAFVRKYDSSGTVLWTRQFGSTGLDQGLGIALGGGGVYVSGVARGALPGQTFLGVGDAFVRKYDAAGTEVWTRAFGTPLFEEARAIAVDATGVYLAGRTDSVLDDPLVILTNSGFSDFYIRKYGHDGSHLWTREFGSPSIDTALALAAGGAAVYIAGSPQGALPGEVFGGGLTDAFIRKYDGAGNQLWTFVLGTPFNDNGRGIVVDGTGIYLVGDTQGTIPGQTSAGDTDAFLVKLDTTPPAILSVVPSQTVIWPPNNKMASISVAVTATDAGTPNPSCQIVSVSSNEAGGGQWEITGPLTLNLMASRNGDGSGRIYTITVRCSDPSGNSSTQSATVTVPHDQGN